MKHRIRQSFIGLLLIAALSLMAEPFQAAEPTSSSTVKKLNIEQLKQNLDRKNIPEAIHLVEQFWKYQYEDYYGSSLANRLLQANEISQRLKELHRLTGNKAALVYAVPTPNHLELILVPAGGRPVHRRILPAKREVLVQTVKSLHDKITDPSTERTTYLPPAQKLYQLLIAPLERDLKAHQIETIVFCLGGGLRTTPLAVLHDGKRFLIEKYNLGLIPAFSLIDLRPTVFKNTKVLAMGASQFKEQNSLPAVPLELSTIASNLWRGEILLNQNFTVANLRAYRAVEPYGIVHLATHADFASGSVSDSYIQFWDRRLSLDRFRELNLRSPSVELLVLSACRTAVGNPQAEMGFAGSSVMSGSKAVIASLWHVSDVGTLVLMTEFYRQLKTSMKTKALRQAQIAMLSKKVSLRNSPALRGQLRSLPPELKPTENIDFSHPFYWAAFVLIGNAW
jgi:CHAT domain-containing protein